MKEKCKKRMLDKSIFLIEILFVFISILVSGLFFSVFYDFLMLYFESFCSYGGVVEKVYFISKSG